MFSRRSFLEASTGLASAAAAGLAVPVFAQGHDASVYPTRTGKILVGAAPGGPVDFMGRMAGDQFSRGLGQAFAVENRPGASGMTAADAVARAAPDGYMLLSTGPSAIVSTPHLYAKMTYDPLKSLAVVGMLGAGAYVIVTHPSVKANNLKEFIQLAKAKPDAFSYGSGGVGSGSHLATEMLCQQTGAKMVHVPYKGDALGYTDLMGGQLQWQIVAPNIVGSSAKDGRVRVLAVTSSERLPNLPDVPTVKESLGIDFEYLGWVGLFAPAGTPVRILDALDQEWQKGRFAGPIRDKLMGLGMAGPDRMRTRKHMEDFIRREHTQMGALIRKLGITADS